MIKSLAGVFPVLATPFDADGQPDEAALIRLVNYLVQCGVDGITFPGVASEVGTLSVVERHRLVDVVLEAVQGRVPVVIGASSSLAATTIELARRAVERGASALMIAGPPDRLSAAAQIDYFTE